MEKDGVRALVVGDQVRFSECLIAVSGVVTEMISADYLEVLWDGCVEPTIHQRSSLELDSTAAILSDRH